MQHFTGDVAGIGGGQKEHRRSDLCRRSEAFEQDAIAELFLGVPE